MFLRLVLDFKTFKTQLYIYLIHVLFIIMSMAEAEGNHNLGWKIQT
jgi:hypothetical protein